AVFAPTSAHTKGSVAQDSRCAALHGDFLQLPAREKRNPLPVRGEERSEGSFRARQFRGFGLIEFTSEKLSLRYIHHPGTIGRKDSVCSNWRTKGQLRPQIDIKAQDRLQFGRAGRTPKQCG